MTNITNSDIPTLKPCPFCGGPAMFLRYGPKQDEFSIGCSESQCAGFMPAALYLVRDHGYGEVERAAAMWNKRTQRTGRT